MTTAALTTTLEAARDALADISGVSSCLIGFEQGISPADYPMIRIEPTLVVAGKPYSARTVEVHIIFGARIAPSEGLETVIAYLARLEASIRTALRDLAGFRYLRTLTVEEDRSNAYRLWAIVCELSEVTA